MTQIDFSLLRLSGSPAREIAGFERFAGDSEIRFRVIATDITREERKARTVARLEINLRSE